MTPYRVEIHGCDDSTIFDVDLSLEELAGVVKVSTASAETSTYGCMPTLKVTKVRPA